MNDTIYGWFENSRGPEDLLGVRLAYIDPVESWFDRACAGAANDPKRLERLKKSKAEYDKTDQKYFTPDLGWWMDWNAYNEGRSGFGGTTRKTIEEKYPTLIICDTREEAIEKAGF